MARVLGIDVGTSSVRAQVFDADAQEREAAQRKYPGENDPARIVGLVREAVAEAADGEDYDAVGGSCFGHSLLALDENGRPLTPILGWRDTRSADPADWLSRRVDTAAVHARTGCHIHTSYWPAKLAWLAAEHPEIWRRTRRFVSFCDFLYAEVLGRPVPSSVSMASATGLLDLHARAWDPELTATLGVEVERLPEISDDAVDGWYPALLDGACSNLGAGLVTRERAGLMIGTSGAFRTVYETAQAHPRAGLFLHWVDERRVVEGGSLSDGGSLVHWLDETLKDAEGSLADRDPESHGLTFLALLGGERSPGWHQHATGAVHGLTFDTTPLDIRQAALEGVAFMFAAVAELMPEVEDVVATGGSLLRDGDWLQIMADALGRPVTASGIKEASLRGAAVVALERLGESPAPAPLGGVVEPRLERADAYRAARDRQRQLYDAVIGSRTT
ncbi:MAG: gluconokinase [Gaiellaceae bacterium]